MAISQEAATPGRRQRPSPHPTRCHGLRCGACASSAESDSRQSRGRPAADSMRSSLAVDRPERSFGAGDLGYVGGRVHRANLAHPVLRPLGAGRRRHAVVSATRTTGAWSQSPQRIPASRSQNETSTPRMLPVVSAGSARSARTRPLRLALCRRRHYNANYVGNSALPASARCVRDVSEMFVTGAQSRILSPLTFDCRSDVSPCLQGFAGCRTLSHKADDGPRTRDLWLGKPTLYQLSYVRAVGRSLCAEDALENEVAQSRCRPSAGAGRPGGSAGKPGDMARFG